MLNGSLGGVRHLPEPRRVWCVELRNHSPSFELCLPRSRKLRWCSGCKIRAYCCAWPVLRCCSCYRKNWRIYWNLGYVSYSPCTTGGLSLFVRPVFPVMIKDFGGSGSAKGNTGPFFVASGLAILSAIIVYFLVTPLDHDGMKEEDAKVRNCQIVPPITHNVYTPHNIVPRIPRSAWFQCLTYGSSQK